MEINGRTIPEETITELILKIKKKKELWTIDEEIVTHEISRYLHKNSKVIDQLLQGRKVAAQTIMKNVRSELRRLYGSYTIHTGDKEKAKVHVSANPSEKNIQAMLEAHKSSSERLEYYEQFYEELYDITGKPKSILDLGCGMNPFSFMYMGLETVNYLASDISKADLETIQSYFDATKEIKGTTTVINLFDANSKNIFDDIKLADVCFLFKVLELVEQSKSHKISEIIISNVPAKWVVVSFPTITISGVPMRYPRRGWIERMLERLCFQHKVLEFENEIYYVIKK